MRANIVRILASLRHSHYISQPPLRVPECRRPVINHLCVRFEQTSGRGANTGEEEEEPGFGDLRKRVLDKVGDNLDQIKKFNAFELFGIQQQYKVNNYQLQQEMRRLQRVLHPDKFVDAKKESQDKSDYLSAAVNDFYAILCNPYERGKYLLSLKSNKSQSEIERSLDSLQVDENFLSEMMDVREKISDPACDTLELGKLGSVIEGEMQNLIVQLDKDFKSNDTDAILQKLGKMKFLVNCHRGISNRCDSFSQY